MLIDYLLGPLFTLLPKRWREGICSLSEQVLSRAATISGILEFLAALFVFRVWYGRFFAMLAEQYVSTVQRVKTNYIQPSDTIGEAGFLFFMTSPLTWVILFFLAEGLFRTFVALGTGEACGTFPLVFIDWLSRALFSSPGSKQEITLVPDEVSPGDGKCDLRISSCRRKPEWKPPYAIRYGGTFFRIIGEKRTGGPRPFVYALRRLAPGEKASGLREYTPDDVLRTPYQVDRFL